MNTQSLVEKEVVNFQIAKRLKDVGFDALCFAYYNISRRFSIDNTSPAKTTTPRFIVTKDFNQFPNKTSAPTWRNVLEWFRGKGLIGIVGYGINPDDKDSLSYTFTIGDLRKKKYDDFMNDNFSTYEEAQEALIKELIKKYKRSLK